MKKFKTLCLTLMIAIFCLPAFATDSHTHKDNFNKGPGFPLARLLSGLDLTIDQKANIFDILEKYKDERTQTEDDMHGARNDLSEAIHADEFNEENIRQACKKVASAMEELIVLKAGIFAEIRPILTTEQIETIKEHKNKKEERMQTRRDFRRSKMEDLFLPTVE